MAAQKFSTLNMIKMEEIYFVADNCGLIRESLEFEKNKSDRSPYWVDQDSGRHFRYNEETNVFEVTSKDMDRWANSVVMSVDLPKTLEAFHCLILESKVMPEPEIDETTKKKTPHSRKSKNIKNAR